MSLRTIVVPAGLAVSVACLLGASGAQAATLEWKGHTWQVTAGGMAGVCAGSPANVSIDTDGYLHLSIRKSGDSWTAAELFTTDKLGFGTYQWHIDGPIDTYDKNVVLGLFPYGPAAGIGDDGTNEIDIEYSRWGVANGDNGDFTNYPASGTTVGELSYTFSLDGSTLSTSRFTWTSSSITSSLLGGLVPVEGDDALIKRFTYAPSNSPQNIPQQALPLGMNLWCFAAPPSDEQPVEIVIRDFTFVPEGRGGAGGSGGSGSGGRASGGDNGAGTGGRGAGAGGRDASGQAGATSGDGGGLGRAGRSAGMSGAGGTRGDENAGRGGSAGANRAGAGNATGEAGKAAGGSAGAGAAGAAGLTPPPETGGSSSLGDSPSQAPGDGRGCGCSVPSSDEHAGRALAAAVIMAMLALGRRRTP